MPEIIDSHQHFWRYAADEFGWIGDDMAQIRRDFLPNDLASEQALTGVAGSIAVQARQTLAETTWLLELAATHPAIRGVVGWVPLSDPKATAAFLDRMGEAGARLRGVRHVLQGEPDAFMAAAGFNAGLREVSERGLTYDLLIYARQLPAALELVDRHPGMRFVVDHIAKPEIDGPPTAEWLQGLRSLAQREGVCCKFSGLVTEVRAKTWSAELLHPYFEAALESFGPNRLMFGSDWPVCLVRSAYPAWLGFVEHCVAPLASNEREAILGGTASLFYRLGAT